MLLISVTTAFKYQTKILEKHLWHNEHNFLRKKSISYSDVSIAWFIMFHGNKIRDKPIWVQNKLWYCNHSYTGEVGQGFKKVEGQ